MPGRDARHRSTGSSRWTAGPRLGLIACTAVLVGSCASGGDVRGEGPGAPSATVVPSTSARTHPVTTVVVSDDPAVSAAGPTATGAWPGELAALLEGSGTALDLEVAAKDAAGFAVEDPAAPSFADLVRDRVVHSTQLVVFSETQFGSAAAPDVAQGAREAFAAVEEAAPDALIVVVAPWTSAPDLPAPTAEVRAAVHAAAQSAEVAVTYVDPVADGWPTGASQQQVAELLLPDVAPLVTALAGSGAFD
ncbi:hypothetical protein SAMN05661080_04217 [Modestobacter sp. DSM 44400]|uniref:hypothetical protein n=1 Tax=Modestobacter sp. DSM 44400 TaxID=1550230 RepID=UPI0008979D51|nr:hypothetical protein [Modestobacter sp. DSM 44400]SDY66716.1 hypothetical protein SAMN05661080_04217 [Modestobacter sp. DSM 44400]